MLVLTRRPQDEFLIGKDIRVQVVSVRGDLVRIGIDAPRSVPIVRTDARNKEPRDRRDEAKR
jgi:carbon storage regulator